MRASSAGNSAGCGNAGDSVSRKSPASAAAHAALAEADGVHVCIGLGHREILLGDTLTRAQQMFLLGALTLTIARLRSSAQP